MANWDANMVVCAHQMICWRGEQNLPNDDHVILIYDRVHGKEGAISGDNNTLINESFYNESKRLALEG